MLARRRDLEKRYASLRQRSATERDTLFGLLRAIEARAARPDRVLVTTWQWLGGPVGVVVAALVAWAVGRRRLVGMVGSGAALFSAVMRFRRLAAPFAVDQREFGPRGISDKGR